jgi:MoaA/NifB/PqqE/SkfB family radical SAM enzyme
MDEKVKRLKNWFSGKPSGPCVIILHPTEKCNLSCMACRDRGRLKHGHEVSRKRYIYLIKEAAGLNVFNCDICGGGEPFARPLTTLAIMKEAKNHGMHGSVNTNGTLLSGKTIELIVRMGWDDVNISLDGPDPEINDLLRGNGTFKKIIRAMQLINYRKKSLNKEKPYLYIYTVVSKKNYLSLDRLVNLAISHKMRGLFLQPVVVRDSHSKRWMMDNSDIGRYKKVLQLIRKKMLKNEIYTNIEYLDKCQNISEEEKDADGKKKAGKDIRMECFSPWLNITVSSDGRAGSCPPSIEYSGSCNIKKSCLKSLWFGETFNELREKILDNKKPDFCRNCGSMESVSNNIVLKEIKDTGRYKERLIHG